MDLRFLVNAASRYIAGGRDWRSRVRRLRFRLAAFRHRRLLQGWVQRAQALPAMQRAIAERPHALGLIKWPYLHKDWNLRTRLDRVHVHYVELQHLPGLQAGVADAKTLCALDDVFPGLRLVLDRPEWFQREGELALNLFHGEKRIFSLAFTLGRSDGRLTAFIGAIQGRDMPDVEALYRELTKALHGARPRDFLLAAFQLLCAVAGVERILGIAEQYRQHRHPFFGAEGKAGKGADYDQIWRDRDGVAVEGGFFELPLLPAVRDPGEIPANKRSMYRKRYALYDRLRGELQAGLRKPMP